MGENKKYFLILVFMIPFVIIPIINMYRKRKFGKEIIGIVRGFNVYIIYAVIWACLCVLWTDLTVDGIKRAYDVLQGKYISSVYQLFDLEYLKNLQEYFYKNKMFSELNIIAFYRSDILHDILWIIVSALTSIMSFINWFDKESLCENGILLSRGVLKYEDITGYRWGEYHRNKHIKTDRSYYELYLTYRPSRLYAKIFRSEEPNEVKIKIDSSQKEVADSFLSTVIKRETGD